MIVADGGEGIAPAAPGAADGTPEARPAPQAGGVLAPGRTTVEEW
jgi:hypothetical protein